MTGKRAKYSARLLCGTAMALATMAAPVWAADRPINIEPQSLASALREFASQSQQAILVAPALADGKSSQGVQGGSDPELALTALLEGTGLTYRRSGDALLIVRADADPQSGSAAGGGAEVEALIVTAQKREEDIQDVPIAISAFSQEDLTRSQIAGGPDLITQVPNMTFTKTNFSSYSIQLRGIGTQAISATTDPAVAVAFNNTPFIRNRFFEQEFYDLQRVEVLRGPQGTLYGRNATAGVVNIISQKPKFAYEAKLSADVSNYSSTRLEGMVNIPLVEDKVALRLAGAWTKRDGYATNELSGNPIDGRDLWSTRLSLRVSPNDRVDANLIWEHFEEDDDRLRSGKQLCKKDVVTHVGDVPITSYLATLGGHEYVQSQLSQGCKRNSLYAQNSFQRPTGLMLPYYVPLGAIGLPTALTDPYVTEYVYDSQGNVDPHQVDVKNDQPEDLRVIQSVVDAAYRAKSDLGELQISFDLTESLTLSSETAYATDWVYSLQDFNRFNTAPGAWDTLNGEGPRLVGRGVLSPDGVFCDPQLGCSDRLMAVDVSTARAIQFSQEFRLASDFQGPFNFSFGGNFLRADSEDKYYIFFNSTSLIAAGGPPFSEFGPYIPNVTDNITCIQDGYAQQDPGGVYAVAGCVYVDPNPIDQVNDQGHNYFLSKNPYKLISYAVFGELYYNVTDDLKVTGGLRWTVDKKDAPRIPSWILATQSVGYPVAEVIEQEWREPTGRLTVDWKPNVGFTDETLVYGSYAHGYKAGGANPPRFVLTYYSDLGSAQDFAAESATRPKTFAPEFVDAFELGTKNTMLDRSLTLNAAAFYYDYKDYQISEIVDRSAYNRNFDATVWGVELEADWRPLENLRLGIKGGYEKTRIADGEEAIDLMDRTAGDPNWIVVRPFPTYASSCILPAFVYANPDGTVGRVGGVAGGGGSGCELAYLLGRDPVTDAPYVDIANGGVPADTNNVGYIQRNNLASHPGYPGWDPATAPNGGEGIMKQLGGNALPNAPEWTATITADYTVPLPREWLMSLHTDLHWQSESWWRIFNDHEYNKLDEYFTMNLAAIFTNEEAGWNIMAYIKNVTDETAITGAFLNSDDTGLTTNVFLTEPRLYGLRVTKNWSGGPLLGSFGRRGEGPSPFTVELGGRIQRHDAPNAAVEPSFASEFEGPLDVVAAPQSDDLDWGDGRDVKLTWRPGGPWSVSAGLRVGETNGYNTREVQQPTEPVCGFDDPAMCEFFASMPPTAHLAAFSRINHAQARITDNEEHELIDLTVGYDVDVPKLSRSTIQAGLRHAQLTSHTLTMLRGTPDWELVEGFVFAPELNVHNIYVGDTEAERKFEGVGPTLSWDASYPLWSGDEAGRLDLDWSLSGGALFGTREVQVSSTETDMYFELSGFYLGFWEALSATPLPVITTTETEFSRSDDVTIPTAGASLGLSYSVGGFKVGAGYQWERYFDAIDGGFEDAKSYDRTIDGPYFKIAVGFGG